MAIRDTLALTGDQRALRDTVRDFLAGQLPSASLRGMMGTGPGYSPELHARLAGELGLTGLTVPGEFGGLGLGRPRRAWCTPSSAASCTRVRSWPAAWRPKLCSRPVTTRLRMARRRPDGGCRSWPPGR